MRNIKMNNTMKLLSNYLVLLVFTSFLFCCSTSSVLLEKQSIDPKAEYHELPTEVKKSILGSNPLSLDEPAYPIGGMQCIYSKLRYTEEAKKLGIEGKILVDVIIDESGDVKSINAINKLGYGLDEIAYIAIANAKFKPAIKEGKPVRSNLKFPFVYKIKD
jgi:TonB family protein